jgi:DNA adenine methylase/adenine-specific DNA-methyltransferase
MQYIKSPFNYIGNKYKLLSQLLPHFPNNINNFYDIFCGGLDVSINVKARNKFANDINYFIIEIFELLRSADPDELISKIKEVISSFGLSKDNSETYYSFREYYNRHKDPLLLFVLVCYSFNHQFRFNSKHEFNTPAGTNRSSFNNAIEKRLRIFCSELENITFTSKNFKEIDFSELSEGDFVYADPPYRLSIGSYNDGKRGFEGWTLQDDITLFNVMDQLHQQKVKFALSNVFHNNGLKNDELIRWSNNYNLFFLDQSYENSNYQRKKGQMTTEVLITNFYEINHG